MEIFQINLDSWDNVKASFLQSFKPKHSAKTICSNLQDLTQKPRESIYIDSPGNIKMFKRFMASKPDMMPQAV